MCSMTPCHEKIEEFPKKNSSIIGFYLLEISLESKQKFCQHFFFFLPVEKRRQKVLSSDK